MRTVQVKVWVPNAKRVDLRTDHSLIPMTAAKANQGFWEVSIPAGTDYKISVDQGEAFPDPRTRFQPFGVHGPSRATDLSFDWTDHNWRGRAMLGDVWYELHVGTFTDEGTFDSAIKRLIHLRNLGIGVIEVMPVAGFPGERGWGYDGVNLFAVHEAYGGPEAFQRFVDAAHNLGLAVALDVVYNHLGPSGNYLAQFGPYFTDRHHTPWGEAVNLDGPGSNHVRQFLLDNARQWFYDFHVDALRLDAIHSLMDDSETHFLAELANEKDQWERDLGRPLALVAESDMNDVKILEPPAIGGYGLDGQWNDDFHHALHAYLTGESFGYYEDFASAEALSEVISNVFLHRGGHSSFRGKAWGRPVPDDMSRERFVVFSQNHDQVGNRAMGDRPEERLSPGQILGGAALLLLSPFTPMLFQGQEWATKTRFQFFTDHGNDIGPGLKEGRTKEFASHGWEELYGTDFQVPDPQDQATFLTSKLDWSELEADGDIHKEILDGYRALIDLRELIKNDPIASSNFGDGWFALHRTNISVFFQIGSGTSLHDVNGELLWSYGTAQIGQSSTLMLGTHSVAVIHRSDR